MASPSDTWYVHENGEQSGPFSEGDLRAMMAQGSVAPTASIWRAGMAEWVAITTLMPPQPRPASSAQMLNAPVNEPSVAEQFEAAMETRPTAKPYTPGSSLQPSYRDRWLAYGVKVGRRSFILHNIILFWTILILLLGVASAVEILGKPDWVFVMEPGFNGQSQFELRTRDIVSSWVYFGGVWLIVGLPCGIAAVVVMEKHE